MGTYVLIFLAAAAATIFLRAKSARATTPSSTETLRHSISGHERLVILAVMVTLHILAWKFWPNLYNHPDRYFWFLVVQAGLVGLFYLHRSKNPVIRVSVERVAAGTFVLGLGLAAVLWINSINRAKGELFAKQQALAVASGEIATCYNRLWLRNCFHPDTVVKEVRSDITLGATIPLEHYLTWIFPDSLIHKNRCKDVFVWSRVENTDKIVFFRAKPGIAPIRTIFVLSNHFPRSNRNPRRKCGDPPPGEKF
jgi:hypothetical protein